MKREEMADGEAAAKGDKHHRRATPLPKPTTPILKMHDISIPQDGEETKQLTAIVKLLKDKNTLAKSTDITALAAKTIKAVEAAQKSGSASFRREATKSLISLREVVSKSEVLSPKRAKVLVDRFDAVSLDAKNASFYMLSTAKQQANDIKKNAEEYKRQTKLEAKEKLKSILAETALKAKKITSEANAAASLTKISVTEDLRAKKKAATEQLSESAKAHKKTLEDDAAKSKLELFREKAALYAEKKKHSDDLKERSSKNRTEVSDRKQKLNDNNRDRVQKIRELAEEHKKKLKAIEAEAKSGAKIQRAKQKEEQAKQKAKKKKRDDQADSFKSTVMEGVYDANPLLKSAVTIFKGVKAMTGQAIDWNKDRKAKKATVDSSVTPAKENAPEIVNQPRPSEVKKTERVPGQLQRVNSSGTTVLKSGTKLEKANVSTVGKIEKISANDGAQSLKLMKAQPVPESMLSAGAANDGKKASSLIKTMFSSLVKVVKQIGSIAKFLGSSAKTIFSRLTSNKNSPKLSNETQDDDSQTSNKGSLLKRVGNKVFGGKQSKLAKIGEGGVPSGVGGVATGAAEGGAAGVAGGVAEAGAGAGMAARVGMGAVEGIGALVAGIAALGELIVPILAVIAGVAAVAGVVSMAKSFFGKKNSTEVVDGANARRGGSSGDWDSKAAVTAADKPSRLDGIADKQATVNNLNDTIDNQTKNAGNVSVVTDNSVRASNTTIVQEKLSTRNDDVILQQYGYGGLAA
jgi:hypothetical protein